jgi:hypothetical protein
MICKFFPTGIGETRKATEYLQHDGARVIKGNLELTRQIADNISRKRKYTSGVLSFSEVDLLPEIKMAIIKDFERVVFPGLLPENYNITWVEHHDKNSLELHFISPRCEMNTGNDYVHYLHRLNINKMDLWKDIINVKYNLSSPFEQDRVLIVKPATRHNKYKKIISNINQTIIDGVTNRIILNSTDVTNTIKSIFKNATIQTEKSRVYILINNDKSRKIVLIGKAYEKNFSGIDDLIEKAKIDHEKHIDNVRKNLDEHVQKLDRLLIKQTEKNIRIFEIDDYQQPAKVDESFNMLFKVDATKINQIGDYDDSDRDKINGFITRIVKISRERNDSITRFNKYIDQTKQYVDSSKRIDSKSINSKSRRSRRRRIYGIHKKFIREFSEVLYGVVESSTSEIAKRFQDINHTQTPDDEFVDKLFRDKLDSEDTDNLYSDKNDYVEANHSNRKR